MREDGRTNNSIKNVITAFVVQILTMIIGVISRTVFVYTLGKDYLGINGLFTSALMLLSLSELGIGDAIVYKLLHLFAENNNEGIKGIFEFSKKIYRSLIVITLIMGAAISPLVFATIKLQQSIDNLHLYYYMFVINIALSYLSAPYTQIFKANQKERITVKGTFISQMIIYVLQIVSLILWSQYVIYLLLMLSQNVVMYLYYRRKYKHNYKFIDKEKALFISENEKKDIVSITKDMFLGKMGAASIASVDNLTISFFVNTTMVGIYSNYVLVFDVIKRIAKLAYNAIYSSIGEINVKETKTVKLKFFKIENYFFFYISTILVTGTYILINPLIELWLGDQYLIEQKMVLAVCIDIYLAIMAYGMENFANTSELYKTIKKCYLKMAISNFVLSIILGYFCGMFGILFATVISRIIYNIELPRVVVNELFDMPLIDYYKDFIIKIAITSLNVCVAGNAIGMLNFHVTIFSFLVEVMLVALISMVVLELCSIGNSEHSFILKKIESIIRKFLFNLRKS